MVTPLGLNRADSFNNAVLGKSAISGAPQSIRNLLPKALAASVPAEFDVGLPRSMATLDRATQFALACSKEALADAQFEATEAQKSRTGVYVGIGMGGAHTIDGLYTRFFEQLQRSAVEKRDPTVMHPLSVPRMMANSAAAAITIAHQLRGQSFTYSIACASSAVALGEAYRALRHGYIDTAIVVGTEAMLTPGSFVVWNALRVMAQPVENAPETSCRPFDAQRSGFILGEGAAAIVLQAEGGDPTCRRQPYGELCGYGTTTDGVHITLPSMAGQVTAMQMALAEAGMNASEIGYLNAHGTATTAGDTIETDSIKQAFGNHAKALAVSSTKAIHGHLIGAGGALEFALSVMAMDSGNIPPTAHLDNPDPVCDLDFVPNTARRGVSLNAVMSNSFAFGGTNASLIARRITN